MMRIVFVIDQLWDPLAGTENQLLKLIRGLGARHEVHLICFRSTPWLEREGASLACTVHVMRIDQFRRPHSYANMAVLWRRLRALRPDVVHTFFPVGNIVGVLIATLAGVKTIVASRRDFGEWMSPRYLRFTRFANRFATSIVTNSSEVKQLTVRVEGFPEDAIEVIPNSIDIGAFEVTARNTSLRDELGVPDGGKLIGLLANYRPMKRHETLVRAARRLADTRRDLRFVLIGRNATPVDLRGQVARLIDELGLAGVVHQMHAAGDVKRFLAALDVSVNCSQGEGLSNAVMECMAAGVPCVVAASGGNTDLVTDGLTGLTFELDNDQALAQQIARLADDDALARRLAANALHRLRAEMGFDAVIDRFDRYYHELAGSPLPVAHANPG